MAASMGCFCSPVRQYDSHVWHTHEMYGRVGRARQMAVQLTKSNRAVLEVMALSVGAISPSRGGRRRGEASRGRARRGGGEGGCVVFGGRKWRRIRIRGRGRSGILGYC
eukprot:scaffold58986_cov64-Phaeocystis_antarctica.AAC.2